jgi:hypothetical protein
VGALVGAEQGLKVEAKDNSSGEQGEAIHELMLASTTSYLWSSPDSS